MYRLILCAAAAVLVAATVQPAAADEKDIGVCMQVGGATKRSPRALVR